ncbi:hypothetical protein VTN77DRAFT_8565 [Rasamsonia byssochlamydoides]|uniref:uncharacterized protein n=1 Tax=Rasamsonia byssochlamydoides TaxID=89139 RepID=UPI003742E8B0
MSVFLHRPHLTLLVLSLSGFPPLSFCVLSRSGGNSKSLCKGQMPTRVIDGKMVLFGDQPVPKWLSSGSGTQATKTLLARGPLPASADSLIPQACSTFHGRRVQQAPVPEEGTVAWTALATVCTVATGVARYGHAPMSRAGGTSRRAHKAGRAAQGGPRWWQDPMAARPREAQGSRDPSQTNYLA